MKRDQTESLWRLNSRDIEMLAAYTEDFNEIQTIIQEHFPLWAKEGWEEDTFKGTKYYIKDFAGQWKALLDDLEKWAHKKIKTTGNRRYFY